MKRIIFCAQDPGGANAIAPVILMAAKDGTMRCDVLAAKHAVKVFERNKIKGVMDCTQSNYGDLSRLYNKINPQVVFMGTSEGYSIEKKVTRIASRHGAETISIIDSWMNYAKRYSSAKNPTDLLYITQTICVNDEFMKRECVKDGIPSEIIQVTGNPHLAESAKKIKFPYEKIGKYNLLFISQPLSRGPISQYSLVKELCEFPQIEQFKNIIVRPHPKENAESRYLRVIKNYKNLSIKIDHSTDLYDLINKSGLVMGVDSIILFECAIAGKVVISYQPYIKSVKKDLLINNKLSLSHKAYNKQDFYTLLSRYLGGTLNPPKNVSMYRKKLIKLDATNKLVNILKKKA